MAAIDKTYFSTKKEYHEIRDWCRSMGRVTDDYGNVFRPLDFMYEYEDSDLAEAPGKEYVLWNTPTYFDIWLIRNCPVGFVQQRLYEQYGGGWSKEAFTEHNDDDMYEQIKNRTSIYDTYKRNGTKGNLRFSVKWHYNARFKDDKLWWWIQIEYHDGVHWSYDDETDCWWTDSEPHPWNTNTAHRHGPMSMGRLRRLLNKWDLPEGTVVSFSGSWKRYEMKRFDVTIKKKNKML